MATGYIEHRVCECDPGHSSPRNGTRTGHPSRKDKILSIDPDFADYDYESYEKEVMGYQDQGNYDFKSIVSKKPPIEYSKIDSQAFHDFESEKQGTSPRFSVLKAAPRVDPNNNSKAHLYRSKNMNESDGRTNTDISDEEFLDSDKMDRDDHENDIRFWIDELSNQFQLDMESVDRSTDDSIEKLREYNEVCRIWIQDIYEQNQILLDALDVIKDTAQKDTTEFHETVRDLRQKLLECHSERSHWKAKADALEYETLKNDDQIKKLTTEALRLKEDKVDRDSNTKRIQKDLEALKLLVIRLREGGVWDLDGLDMSTETFTKVLGTNWKNLYGKKLEGFEDLRREKIELKEELASMRHEREHLRAKLFSKERNLHKLKGEEEAVKARLSFAKAEEGALRNRVGDLKSEVKALVELEKGRDDTVEEFNKL